MTTLHSGGVLERVVFDYAASFEIADALLRVETPMIIITANAESVRIDPQSPNDAASTVLSLLHREVILVTCSDEGALEVSFASGDNITVLPDEDYEAWSFTRSDGHLWVCLPGGGVSSWGDLKPLGSD